MSSEDFYSDSEKVPGNGEDSHAPLLPEEFAALRGETSSPRRLSILARFLVGFGATFLFFALLVIVFWQTQQAGESTPHPELPDQHYCGKTSEDAIRRNCHYEPMLSCWIPDACYTSSPSEGYDPYSELGWYSDPDLTQPLDEKEMAALRYGNFTRVWTTWEYHQHHCLYTWRKLAIAVENHIPFTDTRTAEFEHSMHCASILTDFVLNDQAYGVDANRTALRVTMTMLGCVPLF